MSGRPKRVFITGAAGQDATFVARRCAARGDAVFGISRRATSEPAFTESWAGDITDAAAVDRIVRELVPDECYHFAAYHRSSAAVDTRELDEERLYLETNLMATHALLASLSQHAPACRVLLAGSCHIFGDVAVRPQNEDTPVRPNTLYAITKAAVRQLGRVYRERHQRFVCMAILYNHESPLRGPQFVTRRLAHAAAEAARGRGDGITVGDLEAEVDWGFAGDYAEAMTMMLGAPAAEDFVVASGQLHRVADFARLAFARVGLDWQKHVRQDASVHRRVSPTTYHGDIRRITSTLGWRPRTSFEALVDMMVDAELARANA